MEDLDQTYYKRDKDLIEAFYRETPKNVIVCKLISIQTHVKFLSFYD